MPKPFLPERSEQVQAVAVFLLQGFYDLAGAVGRTVVHDEQVETIGERKYLAYHALNVFLFVVGGYDDQCVGHGTKIFFFGGAEKRLRVWADLIIR